MRSDCAAVLFAVLAIASTSRTASGQTPSQTPSQTQSQSQTQTQTQSPTPTPTPTQSPPIDPPILSPIPVPPPPPSADPDIAPLPSATPATSPSRAPTRTGKKDSDSIFGFTDTNEEPDYFTSRSEPAGFPLIGGNSDIGVQFGGVFTLTHFADGIKPYAWNMDLVLSASVKDGPSGPEIEQQSYLWQLDMPGLDGGKLRLNPMVGYVRTVNEGYYGLGNASSPYRPDGTDGRYFQYIHQEAQARLIVRRKLWGPWDLMSSTIVRDILPEAYPGSRLDIDAHATPDRGPLLLGVRSLGILAEAAGFVYDTRDTEIFPRSGSFHQVGARFNQGVPFDADVRYGQAGAILATYHPIAGPFLWAERVVADFEFGNIPFYDLFHGGSFIPDEMPGGSAGIRGVPVARYSGPIKLIVNTELRAMLFGFHFFGQSFKLGTGAFFDTGRVWTDYTFNNTTLDGKGLGLKWGTGVSAYLLWGQAAIFRMEVAYSPDAEAENPGFPLGIYVEDGVMF